MERKDEGSLSQLELLLRTELSPVELPQDRERELWLVLGSALKGSSPALFTEHSWRHGGSLVHTQVVDVSASLELNQHRGLPLQVPYQLTGLDGKERRGS